MNIGLFASIMLVGTVASAQLELRSATYASTYSTGIVKLSEMSCDESKIRQVLSPNGKVITHLCAKEYKDCMFEGACLVEDNKGRRIGLSYYRYDEAKNQSYFTKVDLKECQYGYGFGKVSGGLAGETCLQPYVTVAADPIEYSLGDVIYVPSVVGLTLPSGEVHDGYLIVADYSVGYVGTGPTKFSYFTGTDRSNTAQNIFSKVGLSDPDRLYNFSVVSGDKADEIRKNKGFKVLRTFKKTFNAPPNNMMGQ